MPKINEMLLKFEGFQYTKPLDLNMGYYHIQINDSASNLCTIILRCGKYIYRRLPMGMSNSLEIFHQKMNHLIQGLELICAYIDQLLVLTKGECTDHVQKLELIWNKLKEIGLKCNIEKSFFEQTQMEYLGFCVTCDGVEHINKNTINKNMTSPTSQKESHPFIGLVIYYWNMWARSSHTLAPLTKITSSKVKFKWTKIEQELFGEIKQIVAGKFY